VQTIKASTISTIQVVEISACSPAASHAIMDARDPAVANDQRTALVA